MTQASVGGDTVGRKGKASIPLDTCQSQVPRLPGPVPGVPGHVAGNMGFGVSKRPVQILPLPHTSCRDPGRLCVAGALQPALGASVSLSVKWG